MIRSMRPTPHRTAASVLSARLLAAACCLVTAAPARAADDVPAAPSGSQQGGPTKILPAGAADEVPVAPSLEEARAEFARNADLRARAETSRDIPLRAINVNATADKELTPNEMWVDPETIRVPANEEAIPLKVDFTTSRVGVGGVWVKHRSYNNKWVGPVIRVPEGRNRKLVIRLKNDMEPADPAPPVHIDVPHGFNTTNLHTHGLHVSPKGNADNVFKEVKSKEEWKFEFPIPDDHPAGTFWYHPHKHGSVALQLSSGLAGALIVEGGIDNYPGFVRQRIAEKVMVFQQIVYYPPEPTGKPAEVLPEAIYPRLQPNPPLVPNEVTLINGQYIPVITMRPGEVQRWRMVHSGIRTTINVNLELHSQLEIALDGIPLRALRPVTFAELQPGYRSDVLIRANNNPGVYGVYNRVNNAQTAFNNRTFDPYLLAKVLVAGDPVNQSLPDGNDWTSWVDNLYKRMPDLRDIEDGEITGARPIEFNVTSTPSKYEINGMEFNPARIDQRIELGAVEKWKLTVATNGGNHPFHIHVNPFQVQVGYPYQPSPRWVWRDTLLVTPTTPAEIRSRFVNFGGKTVLHCHNIVHEDQGMMQAVCIIDRREKDPLCQAPTPVTASPAVGGRASAWRLLDAAGREVASADYRGRRLLLVFHRGFDCWHCAEQVALLERSAGEFRNLEVKVLVVSPGAGADAPASALKDGPAALHLLRDPTLDAFRAFGCVADGQVLHGAFLIDGDGRVRWARVGDRPETDIGLILENARKLASTPRGPVGPVATK